MAFFDDTGIDEDALNSPIWGAFALVKDQLERLIALNLVWSLQLVPILAAFGFPALPLWLRIAFVVYSCAALAPATGVLYCSIAQVCQQEPLSVDMLKANFADVWRASVMRLAPLYGVLGVLLWVAIFSALLHNILLDTVVRFSILAVFASSIYWGPLFAQDPERSSLTIFQRSAALIWRYPGKTVVSLVVIGLALLLGIVSIGGLFLIVPVVVAVLQTLRYQELFTREQMRARRREQRLQGAEMVQSH